MVWLKCPAGIAELRSQTGICEVAMSGGVWQNMTLLERTTANLCEDGLRFIFTAVPTNDGGLSLGQAMVGRIQVWRIIYDNPMQLFMMTG